MVQEQNPKKKTRHILIVEDDPAIRPLLKEALEFQEYNVHTAENGKVALDLLPQITRPCLILLDLMMPVMDGWEFLDHLLDDPRFSSIPVILVTAYANKADNLESKTKGLIEKPINLEDLYEAVSYWCKPAE